jgi:hypothetical protein
MYVDKPMRGHGLMQAIARVNRVFKDKPGGLVVDYLGIAHELKLALATYTESGGKGATALPQEEAVAVMLEKYEVCRGLFHGFDWLAWIGKEGVSEMSVPRLSQETLAEMVGTTRSRGSFFMNRFRKLGFINYDLGDNLHIHSSLLNVVLQDEETLAAERLTVHSKSGLELPARHGGPADNERARRPPLSSVRRRRRKSAR